MHSYARTQNASARFCGVFRGEDVLFCGSGGKNALRAAQAVRQRDVMVNPAEHCHTVTQALKSLRFLSVKGKIRMKQDKNKHQDAGKLLRNTIRIRRWSVIGGTAVGLQALLSVFTRPEEPGAVLFQAILAIGCIGYGLSLTPRIRSLAQASEAVK